VARCATVTSETICTVVMATVEYSYSDICDHDQSGYSDVSDTELSQACDVLLQHIEMAWQIKTLLTSCRTFANRVRALTR